MMEPPNKRIPMTNKGPIGKPEPEQNEKRPPLSTQGRALLEGGQSVSYPKGSRQRRWFQPREYP